MWVAVLGLVLSVLTGGYSTALAEWGSFIDARAISLANQIAKEISKNENLVNSLQMAYNQKNNELINSLFRGSGFGPRAENLRKNLAKNEVATQEAVRKLNNINTEKRSTQTMADTAAQLGGTSVAGNIKANKFIDEAEAKNKEINAKQESIGLNQNINGGIQSNV